MPVQGLIPSRLTVARPSLSRKRDFPALAIFCSISSAEILSPVAKSKYSPRGVQYADSSALMVSASISSPSEFPTCSSAPEMVLAVPES
ncbi:hypothetical protein KLPMMMO221M1_24730 [Klebsiella pneumoniae]